MHIEDWIELEDIRGDLQQYRARSVAVLRKYFRMSVEMGRLPSLLGREFFRAQVTNYTTHTFEDAVIFVHDTERALELLDRAQQLLLARVIFQEYTHSEAAELLGVPETTLVRDVAVALDSLSQVMLDRGLIQRSDVPLSASEARKWKCNEARPKRAPVSVNYLLSLRNPTFSQSRKFAKVRLTRSS